MSALASSLSTMTVWGTLLILGCPVLSIALVEASRAYGGRHALTSNVLCQVGISRSRRGRSG